MYCMHIHTLPLLSQVALGFCYVVVCSFSDLFFSLYMHVHCSYSVMLYPHAVMLIHVYTLYNVCAGLNNTGDLPLY